jgi:hypothetical protein
MANIRREAIETGEFLKQCGMDELGDLLLELSEELRKTSLKVIESERAKDKAVRMFRKSADVLEKVVIK